MSVKCQVIMDELDRIAPRYLAESWDNVGLLVGSPLQDVSNLMVALDVTGDVIKQAIATHTDMIITHHPFIFKGIKNVRADLPHGRLLTELIKNDIAVYAAHTNLDIAVGGINDVLANRLHLADIEVLSSSHSDKLIKLVVFTPKSHAESVRRAISEAGAGYIGNYSHCTFATDGVGTFLPLADTNPFIGTAGVLEQVAEVRLETVLPEKISQRVLNAMFKAHPYEEVAYDLYPLVNDGPKIGLGRMGNLPTTKLLAVFANDVKKMLGINWVKVAGPSDKAVRKVAVCGGSGASLIQTAALAGADVLVTGDVKYHEAQDAVSAGIAIIDAGHFGTENVIVDHLGQYLDERACQGKWGVEIVTDKSSKDIFNRY